MRERKEERKGGKEKKRDPPASYMVLKKCTSFSPLCVTNPECYPTKKTGKFIALSVKLPLSDMF